MFENGEAIESVAKFIRKFLKIVLISRDEQQYLDYELGLKQTMPPGWIFENSCEFERLTAANIEYELYSTNA